LSGLIGKIEDEISWSRLIKFIMKKTNFIMNLKKFENSEKLNKFKEINKVIF